MAYQKTVWKDQDVENPRTYVMRDNGDDTVTLLDAFGTVTELGTPVNAANMNKIENGIADLETYINTVLISLYPVGSLYIGTQSTCPLATLISGSQWELVAQDRALWGGNGSNANTTIEAGLPNITGKFTNENTSQADGCFYRTSEDRQAGRSGYDNYNDWFYFDASRSSAIYGNSNTVQPPAYRVNIWRRTA